MKNLKNGIYIVGLMLVFAIYANAQAFTVIKATRQPWAGGVVGRSGISYTIELETTSRTGVPDTVWINGYVYPIDAFSSNGQYIKAMDSVTHKIRYSILVSETHNSRFNRGPTAPQQDTTTEKPKHLRAFEGAALISYMHKKKERFFTIKSFMNLKPLNYP